MTAQPTSPPEIAHLRHKPTKLCGLQGDLSNVRDEINKYKVGAPARVGLVAPNDVFVPAGGTGLDPSQTNFFQARSLLADQHTSHCSICI